MTDQENRKTPAELGSPNTENLLQDFGAGQKKTGGSGQSSKSAAPPKAASESSAQGSREEPKAATSEKASGSNRTSNTNHSKKAASSGNATKKSGQANSKKGDTKTKTAREEVKRSTAADDSSKKEKEKKVAVDLDNRPRSTRPAHQVIPYVLIIFAVFIGVSLLLNLFCNGGNKLASDPSAHWMGVAGYYICYALFGVFGPAVFALPLLLLNLAFFWKRYIDHRLTISKIAVSLLFLILLGAVIHIFCLFVDPVGREFTTQQMMEAGAKMTFGGVLGGKVGNFFVHYLNMVGALIIGICLLAVSLFFFLGMTPEHLWEHIRVRRAMRANRIPSISEQDAEAARNRALMEEKIRRSTTRQMHIDDEAFEEEPDAAPETGKEPVPTKKSEDDKLAPMPKPRLNPGVENRLFVPPDVSRKLHEEKRKEQLAAQQQRTAVNPAPAASANTTKPAAGGTQAPAAGTPSAPAAPVVTADPAQNRDAAVDPIFPKTVDAKQIRKIPKEDRLFDLRNVFIDLDDNEKTAQPRKHAPVPPEVPLNNARPASGTTAQPVQRPATGSVAASKTAQASSSVSASPQKPVGKAPVPAGANPATVQKPIFSHAESAGDQDYGLSSEEFEKLEATHTSLPKVGTTTAKSSEKSAPAAPQKSAPTDKAPAGEQKSAPPAPKPASPKKYVFPPISYLHPGEPMTEENRAEIEESMTQLADTLASFHVRVQAINYSCGPTVTRYEVILAPGVRVRTVTNLADDIALALRSSGGVRIEAPIPGTNAVGIEVPNKTRSTIYLRDLIESKAFAESKSKLSACLGADIAGKPLIFDIAKMPHLLIAGTTGSGKSVCINCIIMSLLYKVRPDEVKLVLIDPKKVEFSIYKNIPHLMAPVVTQPKDAAGALQAAVEEMERRFEVFETVGVRDLKGYNEVTKDDPDMPYIPHMVIIIDELADLMMTAKNEVETAICRIAQKARAAGMHLIIGTQRPSADVVTGLIKANVPSSIAFAVKSQIDSRVILDHGGAEALTGRGDMLFVPIGAMRDTRVQGAFVDDKEVEKICEFIRVTNGTAQYDEKFTSKLKELAAQCGGKGKSQDDAVPMGADGEKGDDPKYADAVRVAVEEKRISTSLLQRKLEVGYSRAAKLIDRMQAEGIVSAPDGAKPRAILITPEEYIERFVDKPNEE